VPKVLASGRCAGRAAAWRQARHDGGCHRQDDPHHPGV